MKGKEDRKTFILVTSSFVTRLPLFWLAFMWSARKVGRPLSYNKIDLKSSLSFLVKSRKRRKEQGTSSTYSKKENHRNFLVFILKRNEGFILHQNKSSLYILYSIFGYTYHIKYGRRHRSSHRKVESWG